MFWKYKEMHNAQNCRLVFFPFLFFDLGLHIPGNLTGKGACDIYQTTGGKRGSVSKLVRWQKRDDKALTKGLTWLRLFPHIKALVALLLRQLAWKAVHRYFKVASHYLCGANSRTQPFLEWFLRLQLSWRERSAVSELFQCSVRICLGRRTASI